MQSADERVHSPEEDGPHEAHEDREDDPEADLRMHAPYMHMPMRGRCTCGHMHVCMHVCMFEIPRPTSALMPSETISPSKPPLTILTYLRRRGAAEMQPRCR